MEEGVCATCLCRERALQPLQPAAAAYTAILAGFQPHDELVHIAMLSFICWECAALLRRVLQFQSRALHSQLMLQSYDVKNISYSCLGAHMKIGFDVELEHEKEDTENDERDETLAQVKFELEPTQVTHGAETAAEVEDKPTKKKKIIRSHRKQIKKEKNVRVRTLELSEHEMRRHIESERDSETYARAPHKCEWCVRGFIFPALLERHVAEKHNPVNSSACDICRQRFATEDLLSKHRRTHYLMYRCMSCEFTSRGQASAERHVSEAHTPASPLPCPECGVEFATKRKLRYHRDSAHSEPVKCHVCGKLMINKYSLKHHMLTHTGMPTYACELCGRVYRGEAGLYSHMRLAHPAQPVDTYCAQCDIHFKNKTIYRSHLKRSPKHATPEQLKFACEKCPKRFISEASLRKHHRYYHLDYVCHICHKPLKNWFSLDNHIKCVHEGRELPRNHMCELCGKGFKTKTMLNNHQTTHSGERPHACDICGAAFSVKASLRTHKRHVHHKTQKPSPVVTSNVYHF